MSQLNLFCIFHLNMSYSSIEEEQRAEVIKNCYWPILHLVRTRRIPLGIEASGYTLQTINTIDPEWIMEFKRLLNEKRCQYIGSGYVQLIGPLVPYEINRRNQLFGVDIARELLGIDPEIALVNEQAYSAGLLPVYKNAGYKAIVMEWDNAASFHEEWSKEIKYTPQVCVSQSGDTLPLIWNSSIGFQQFQRYVHMEIELDTYLQYLNRQLGKQIRYWCIYANDAEVFGFRPGRYESEPLRDGMDREWQRIEALFERLSHISHFKIVSPDDVLNAVDENTPPVSLECAAQPVTVKKQDKYNITRWSVTGRNDTEINSSCFQLYHILNNNAHATQAQWQTLCYLWGSDFRTHITQARWQRYLVQFTELQQQIDKLSANIKKPTHAHEALGEAYIEPFSDTFCKTKGEKVCCDVDDSEHYLTINNSHMSLVLNKRRGLCIEKLFVSKVSDAWLCGTIPHGYFDHIGVSADWYSGHCVIESAGQAKVTDLSPCQFHIQQQPHCMQLSTQIESKLGVLRKTYVIHNDSAGIDLRFDLDLIRKPLGMIRLGFITLNPEGFETDSLYYATHNGGESMDRFSLRERGFNHADNVSFLVSARNGIGMTEGQLELGDSRRALRITLDHSVCAPMGFIHYRPCADSYLLRTKFSVLELDDTSVRNNGDRYQVSFAMRIEGLVHE